LSSKRPPVLTWQDKAILIAIPLVVLGVFILANHFSQDLTVADAFEQQLKEVDVRDGGSVIQLYTPIATDTLSCRIKSRDGKVDFDLIYPIQASETIKFELGRSVQFFGQYEHNEKGGTVTAPYKTKSGRMNGWTIYENHRYTGINSGETADPMADLPGVP
jgi:hypothetical protein